MHCVKIFLILNTSWYFSSSTRTERLLLDIPPVTTNRMGQLENTIAILNSTVQLLISDNQRMTAQNIHQTTTIQQLSNSLQQIKSTNHNITAHYHDLKMKFKQLENTVFFMNNSVHVLTSENQHLTTENIQQTTFLQHILKEYEQLSKGYPELVNKISQHEKEQYGTTYIRWARKQCPNNNSEIIYSGYAAGGYFGQEGSAAEPVCLPPDPDFEKTTGGDYGRIYGAEYGSNFFTTHDVYQDVPCAVCRVAHASSDIMIPGKNKCYRGWNLEYKGYLVSNSHDHKAAGTYVCFDSNPEYLTGGGRGDNGKLFYEVIAVCGALQCPPYKNGYPLTCVVCSK